MAMPNTGGRNQPSRVIRIANPVNPFGDRFRSENTGNSPVDEFDAIRVDNSRHGGTPEDRPLKAYRAPGAKKTRG